MVMVDSKLNTYEHKSLYYADGVLIGWRWLDSMFVQCSLCPKKYLTYLESVEQHYEAEHGQ